MRTIIGKVAFGVSIFLVLLSFIALQAIYGVSITATSVRYLARTALPQSALYERFDLQLSRTVTDLTETLYTRSPATLAEASMHTADAQQTLVALEQASATTDDPTFAQLTAARRDLFRQVEHLQSQIASEQLAQGSTASTRSMTELAQIETTLDQLIDLRHAALTHLIDQKSAEAETPVQAALLAAPLGFLAIGLVAIIMVWVLHRSIVQPVRALAHMATALGEGQLDQATTTTRTDEIGMLQRALHQTAANLRERELAITKRAQQIMEHQRVELALIQARDTAEAANRAKNAILSMMSHELRTPLTAIIGFSQLIEQMAKAGDYHTIIDDVGHIQTAGRRLMALINDILTFSQIEAGKFKLSIEYLSIVGLVHDVTTKVIPLLDQGGNTLSIARHDQAIHMYTDGASVHQALLNLLNNAAKFTESGTITLTITQEQIADTTWMTFQVADSGIGIAPDKIQKLFKPFSQIDDSDNRRYGGTGLSLALSQRICQLLGGEITVESEIGVGSVFTMRLPAVAEQLPVPSSSTYVEAYRPALSAPNGELHAYNTGR